MNTLDTRCRPESDSLDWDALSKRCMGNASLIERVLIGFRDQLNGELEQLEQALEQCDEATVATVAHRMKGTSLTVSANRLADSAQQLQELALNDFASIDEELTGMRNEILQLSEMITKRFPEGAS